MSEKGKGNMKTGTSLQLDGTKVLMAESSSAKPQKLNHTSSRIDLEQNLKEGQHSPIEA